MPPQQSLSLDQRLSLRLSAQQLRFVKLLELNTPEIEEAIERELDDNPALERVDPAPEPQDDIPAYRFNARNSSPDDFADYDFSPPDAEESLYEMLLRQLNEKDLQAKVRQAAEYIVGSLDSNGYLRRPLPSLVNDMAFGPGIEVSQQEAAQALKAVQSLEPYGVGATSLQECLRLQLEHLQPSHTRDVALEIIDRQFEAFSMKHTHRIISGLKLSKEEVRDAIDLIVSLNPKPGASVGSGSEASNVIIPDLIIDNENGHLTVSTNSGLPELAIEQSFAEAVAAMENGASRRKARKGMEFVTSRYNDARDFIRILRQRRDTLLSVMTAIMKIQEEYFRTEDVYRLKPMMIKDIASLTGLDFSVISRATNNKYVATPWGVFPLRFFFSDSIGEEEGEDSSDILTNRKIEAEIAALVEQEDKKHPLSDEKIRSLMEERGYDVSRRTVAKYRDRQGIPVARLRKEM
jgi:RNA polymerase sigma-54 factor